MRVCVCACKCIILVIIYACLLDYFLMSIFFLQKYGKNKILMQSFFIFFEKNNKTKIVSSYSDILRLVP